MSKINVGKVSPVPKGNWGGANAAYEKLNMVNYNGVLYIAKQNIAANSNIAITNTNYWMQATNSWGEVQVTIDNSLENAAIGDISTPGGNINQLNLRMPGYVYGTEIIDDTASDGNGNVVWSAEKTFNEVTEIRNITSPVYDKYGYVRYNFGAPTSDKILDSVTGKLKPGTGSGNNYAFESFVEILPNTTIYFAFPYNVTYNVVFYNEKKEVVDTIGTQASPVKIYGYEYTNTSAKYMRVGAWESGGVHAYIECYAYSYIGVPEDWRTPLILNVDPTGARTYTNISTTYLYADQALRISSADKTKAKFGILVYDKTKTLVQTFYLNTLMDNDLTACIPSGAYIKLYIRNSIAPGTGSISATEEVLNSIRIEPVKNNLDIASITAESWTLNSTNQRISTIDKEYADTDIVITANGTDIVINYALYNTPDYNAVPIFTAFSCTESVLIPKGLYYRYSFGKSTTAQPKMTMVTVTKIDKSQKDYATSGIWKTRFQHDKDIVPEYYEQHIENKLGTINNISTADVQFIFVTDYHYGTYDNTHTARPLLTKIVKGTKAMIVFNGGDTWTRGTADSTSLEQSKSRVIAGIDETIPNSYCDFFYVLGNHDTGLDYKVSDGQTITYGPEFTTKELQRIIGGNITDHAVIYDPCSYGNAYYFDYGDNIRFIVTNVGETSVGGLENADQIRLFMINALLSLGNRKAIIISHIYFSSVDQTVNTDAQKIASIITAYNARSTYTYKTSQVADFSDCTGTVAAFVAGHLHKDIQSILSDGTPVFAVTSTNAGAGRTQGENRVNGTISENAFDVFSIDTTNHMVYATRIGYGSDRQASFLDLDS